MRPAPERSDLFNLKKGKYSMVTILAVLTCEETEENKYVTDAHPLVCEVRLGSASLTKGAPSVAKHRVFMAEVFRAYPPLCGPRHNIAQPRHLISRFRSFCGGDW
jgi:hypothetical protein